MATQIFIEPELEELETQEKSSEWNLLCEDLGLEKQLHHTRGSVESKAPPYMLIDQKTEKIIRALCPLGVDYKEYSASTIPLDVLQEIKKCVDNNWYKEIKIFYDNTSPDPFVVGYTHPEGKWNNQHWHLIARWGAEMLPFEILEQKVIARLKDKCYRALVDLKNNVDFGIQNTDKFISGMLGDDATLKLNFHISDLGWWTPFSTRIKL